MSTQSAFRSAARAIAALLAGAALLATTLVVGAPPAAATTIVEVTTTADTVAADGVTSLREAISAATSSGDANDVVRLAAGATYELTLCTGPVDEDGNLGGDLDYTQAAVPGLRIEGRGATIRQTCADERVVHAGSSSGLALQDVTITGGDAGSFTGGGGVLGGPVGVSLLRTQIVDNESINIGGGVLVAGGSILAEESTISGNLSQFYGGGLAATSQVTLLRSTLSGNTATEEGGGAYSAAAGVQAVDSTIDGNNTFINGAAITAASTIDLTRTTVAGNVAIGGSDSASLAAATSVSLTQSVVAPGAGVSCNTPAGGSGGYSRAADASCGIGASTGDVVSATPAGLGPLQDNGGPTATRQPTSGSPLIGAVPAGFGSCTGTDQRGVGRPQGGACEIGAVEVPLPFTDVTGSHPFFAEIMWMDANDISTGFSDGTYRPSASVSRQAMSAFMYRLAGEPAFTPGAPTFTDVSATHTFFPEIEWMASEGITEGFLPGPTYRPASPVTRQAMSAFMFRLVGEPALPPPAGPTFTDVSATHQFFEEIEWMAAEGITTGFQPGPTYRPSADVSRQAMSAFMRRLAPFLVP